MQSRHQSTTIILALLLVFFAAVPGFAQTDIAASLYGTFNHVSSGNGTVFSSTGKFTNTVEPMPGAYFRVLIPRLTSSIFPHSNMAIGAKPDATSNYTKRDVILRAQCGRSKMRLD